jgi:hypothetical protein
MTLSLAHTQSNVLGISCLVLGVAFDWLGIGKDAIADRFAAALIWTGVAKLAHGSDFDHNVTLLASALSMSEPWAVTVSNLIGICAMVVAIGSFLPESASRGAVGRLAKRSWSAKKRVFKGRINPVVYILPGLLGLFPVTGGFLGVVFGILMGAVTGITSAAVMFLSGTA